MKNPHFEQNGIRISKQKYLKMYIPIDQFSKGKGRIIDNNVSKSNKKLICNLFAQRFRSKQYRRQQSVGPTNIGLKKMQKRCGKIDQVYLKNINLRSPRALVGKKNHNSLQRQAIDIEQFSTNMDSAANNKLKLKRFSISRMLQKVDSTIKNGVGENYRTLNQVLERSFTVHLSDKCETQHPMNIKRRAVSEMRKRNYVTLSSKSPDSLVLSHRATKKKTAHDFQGILKISKPATAKVSARYERCSIPSSSLRCHSRGLSVRQYDPTSYKSAAKTEKWSLQAWKDIQKGGYYVNPQLQQQQKDRKQQLMQ